jgi:hypothetical protein
MNRMISFAVIGSGLLRINWRTSVAHHLAEDTGC